ncbi:carbon-nitrogen hydrolase family protein [Caulobacter sp. 17J65-9]|uniref:carbon-nitrogen hydrolase family protein n=1 Tax=Caulobacter sp. 17J65-9 TaxID=2709382 RepID=UPI0013C7F504|nr:carbon-nitrogen hydrolase family protein [Caulobacter sp. 17J65-9]NEX94413.1 carbon-nitrogen hydrolase family protein [Caulobacter sp. 17J65-9]
MRSFGSFVLKALAAVAVGVVLRFVVGLTPVWWLVWLAPAPLLALAFRNRASDARWMVALAALIATSTNFSYYRLVAPLEFAVLAVVGQAALWFAVVMATRRVVLACKAWWTVFAYPVFWVAADTLMAALLPDGNWASLAYSQADILPLLQLTSLFGVPGLLFLVALVPSALALGLAFGRDLRHGWRAYAVTLALVVAATVFGTVRLQTPAAGNAVSIGIASIDDAIGLQASGPYTARILDAYDRKVAALASRGAEVVVLPEKIALLPSASAEAWRARFSAMARANKVWLEAGVGLDEGGRQLNLAWLFDPNGELTDQYQKHYLAPPERGRYVPGTDFSVRSIGGAKYGLAVCKDMHFAALGRAYGARGASVVLVPAWDFNYADAWMESRTTVTRGVENGYTVVRASREGLLTVSDPYGRVLAETSSRPLPGADLLVRAPVSAPVPTLYTQIGDVVGWACVLLAAALAALGRRRGPAPEPGRVGVGTPSPA